MPARFQRWRGFREGVKPIQSDGSDAGESLGRSGMGGLPLDYTFRGGVKTGNLPGLGEVVPRLRDPEEGDRGTFVEGVVGRRHPIA